MDFMMRVLRQDCRLQADGEIQHLLCDTYDPKNTWIITPLVVPWWEKNGSWCPCHKEQRGGRLPPQLMPSISSYINVSCTILLIAISHTADYIIL
ncbi:hypothetical protein R3I93_012766 [Phoxinus phoxinus]|uniref:Uncharacterized protein n=1 Tax=Phoxinus phoxinus TaxID=58324 RepID=A0AAN9CSL0_9TELE